MMIMSVCVSVCLSVCPHAYLWNHTRPIFTKFFELVIHGRCSVPFWRRCNMLRTSGCADDVMFLIMGSLGACRYRCSVVHTPTPLL